MKKMILSALPVAVLLASVCTGAEVLTPPKITHDFVREQAACNICHVVEAEEGDTILVADEFKSSFNGICSGCHKKEIGRSHPVDINPYELVTRSNYPAELPLQWSEDQMSEVMTCVTCHKPHGDRISTKRLYERQKVLKGTADSYLTYYLRKRGSTPSEGYAPLCKACHPDL